jgi:hypothetical protein
MRNIFAQRQWAHAQAEKQKLEAAGLVPYKAVCLDNRRAGKRNLLKSAHAFATDRTRLTTPDMSRNLYLIL